MERDEMKRILEEIARESPNPTARVSAIRALRQLAEEDEDPRQRTLLAFEQIAAERRL